MKHPKHIQCPIYNLSVYFQRRYTRVNSQGGSLYGGGPEYDDPANCAPEDDQYGSQYGGNYGAPYDHYGSRNSVGRRSVGKYIIIPFISSEISYRFYIL